MAPIHKRGKLDAQLMPSPVHQTYLKGNAMMKSVFKPLLLAGLLASAGFSALAQAPAMGEGPGMMGGAMHDGMKHERMGNMDGSKMQAHMDKRHAALKAQLKLTPAQEGAWSSYTAAMKPPVDMMKQHYADQAELAKLSTPERIDKMKALRAQHMNDMNAVMDKRGDATKAFYATLTPEQQKVFDAHAMYPQGAGRHMGGRMGMDGKAPAPPAKP
jgi:protein CpxP